MTSLDRQIAEIAREIAIRQNAYRKWVESGRLTKAKADQQIEDMTAALETLETLRNFLDRIGHETEMTRAR